MRRIGSLLLAFLLCLTLAVPSAVFAEDAPLQPVISIFWTGADGTPYSAAATPVVGSDGLTTLYFIPADQTMLTGETSTYYLELTGWVEGAIVSPDASMEQMLEMI